MYSTSVVKSFYMYGLLTLKTGHSLLASQKMKLQLLNYY